MVSTALIRRWQGSMPRLLGQGIGAAPLTGSTGETTLATIRVPAGLLGANGQLEITTLWSMTNNANVKTFRVKLGSTTFAQIALASFLGYQHFTRIINRNNPALQVSMPATTSIVFGGTGGGLATGTVDTAQDQSLTITAQLAVGTDTVTLEGYSVRALPKS